MFGKLFAKFGGFMDDCVSNLGTFIKQVSTRDSLNRLAAVAYLVAKADGSVDPEETDTFKKIVGRSNPQFSESDAQEAFNACRSMSDADLYAMIEQAGNDEADLLIRCGVGIGGADGDFDDNEKKVVREICARLFLSAGNYGL